MKFVIVVLLLSIILAPTTQLVFAQSVDPEIVPGTVGIDGVTQAALVKAIANANSILPVAAHFFAVTDMSPVRDHFFVSMVGMEEYQGSWTLDENVIWLGVAIMKHSESGITAAIQGTPAFSSMLSQVPEKYLSDQSKSGLDPLAPAGLSGTTSAEIPRFPWETYYNMQYGSESVHANGFISGWKAVDFLSDGNTSAGHAPNKLLASLSGSIDYVCRDGRSAAIRIDNFFYTHLIDNANLQVGKSFAQGDTLGQMKPGTFAQDNANYPCGYAYQASGTFHVHWGFPNLSTLEVAGWVLNTSTGVWTNGGQTKNTYDWIYANRTYCTGTTLTATQVITYTGLNYCGNYSVLNIGDYPDATSIGLADNSITSIKTGANVKAVVYGNANYSGISEELNASDFDLRNNTIGNDSISSIKVISLSDTVPTVVSIMRTGPGFTSASDVEFAVTFSEPVSDVDANDFTVTTTGSISGTAITQVFDSSSIYTVMVNTGAGNGAIRLDVVDNNTIVDSTGNLLGGTNLGDGNFAGGESYTILKTPTFGDVPLDYWAWSNIELLAAAGITSGCGGGNFCPTAAVTRDQMAVFLLKSEHGSGYVPPAATGVFSDVPVKYWAASWIEQLAIEAVTAGCGGGNFCPTTPVTRDQMAVFLLKAKHGSSYVPPAATGAFSDVPVNYWAARWIEQLATEGVTAGCGGGNYCPTTPVTRDQMAVFLVKNFNLP